MENLIKEYKMTIIGSHEGDSEESHKRERVCAKAN